MRRLEYAAFIVEPIQGEGGIIVPPEGYLKRAEELCKDSGSLLIVDEVQTGFGRTGKMFAAQHEGVEPDIMTFAKSLGGGIIPIGAYIASDEVWSKGYGSSDKCVLHTSTFGGNTRACAVGLKVMEILLREGLPEKAETNGEKFIDELKRVSEEHGLVKEVRGKGLMIGMEFYEPRIAKGLSREYLAAMVAGILIQKYGIITAYTMNNPNVIRMEPPLIVSEEQIDYVVKAIREICEKHRSFLGLAADFGKRLIKKRFGA